jgi:hypothetical protein
LPRPKVRARGLSNRRRRTQLGAVAAFLKLQAPRGSTNFSPETIAAAMQGSGYSVELVAELKAAGHYDAILAEAAAAGSRTDFDCCLLRIRRLIWGCASPNRSSPLLFLCGDALGPSNLLLLRFALGSPFATRQSRARPIGTPLLIVIVLVIHFPLPCCRRL